VDKRDRESLARRVLDRSSADQTEVLVARSNSALTRFTKGVANQNVASADNAVSVRAIVDNKTGVAATNRLDDASLDEVVQRAIAMAHLAPPDPLQPKLPVGGAATPSPAAYVADTADVDPSRRAKLCDAIIAAAESAGYWGSGYASTSSAGYTIANTSGALASFDGTDAGVNVKITADDSTGFAEQYSTDVNALDAAAVGARAVAKARGTAKPRSVDPGPWTVILEPAAFGELLAYLVSHFSAQSFDEGSSFCSDGLDRSYFADSVSISDDYAHRLAPGMPFDFEGQPKLRVPLVEAGVVRNVVTDSYYAHKLHRPNTGHALPAPNAYGPQAMNVVVAPGTQSIEELIASTKRGLLVTRFWYIRTVDQARS
jgi:predicted Zn-dependent protease